MVKAAVCEGAGKDLVIEDINIRDTGDNEVKVDIKACAICHSDILYASGGWGDFDPTVFGHEAAGVVTEIGSGVEHVKVGDNVVVALIRGCSECKHCKTNGEPYCTTKFELDHETPLTRQDGSPLVHGLRTGAFAEVALVHKSQVVAIDKKIPFESASLLACGVITGFGAVINTANIEVGSNVAVIGTGGVGINAIQGAKFGKAGTVIAIDFDDEKLELTKSFGSTHTINPQNEDLMDKVSQITNGEMLDYVFMCAGSGKAIETAYSILGQCGTVVCVGMPKTGDTSTFDGTDLAGGGKRIIGSKMGSSKISVDIPKLVQSYEAGEFKLDELVSGRYKLEQINEAFEATKGGGVMRNVIIFD